MPAWREAWTPARARLWLVAAAIAAYLPLLGVPFRGWLDFSAFYTAGTLAFQREVAQLAPVVRYQAEHGLPITPFPYPAGVALAYLPFSWLPYGIAGALHALVMLAALVLAVRLGADLLGLPWRWALLAALAWAPAAAGIASGQNASVALLLVVLAARAMTPRRDSPDGVHQPSGGRMTAAAGIRGGAAIGALLYKPQLAAPLVALAVLRGRRAAFASIAALIGLHYLLGVVATGGDLGWPADWLATLRGYAGEDMRVNGWQAISLPAVLGRSDAPGGPPLLALSGYLAGGLIVVRCLPALRRWSLPAAVALACAAGLVVSPHAWVYDATLLLPALGIFAGSAAGRGWPWQDRWLLAGAYAIALTWPLGGLVGGTLMAVVVVATPLVLLGAGPFGRFATVAAGTERGRPP